MDAAAFSDGRLYQSGPHMWLEERFKFIWIGASSWYFDLIHPTCQQLYTVVSVSDILRKLFSGFHFNKVIKCHAVLTQVILNVYGCCCYVNIIKHPISLRMKGTYAVSPLVSNEWVWNCDICSHASNLRGALHHMLLNTDYWVYSSCDFQKV